MSNRLYRLLYGALLLIALYFELDILIYVLIGLAVFEAVTNLRIPKLISRIRFGNNGDPMEGTIGLNFKTRTRFEAERGWRLTVASMLAISVFVFPDTLWFFPWFMGFAVFGAGVSGVCPMFLLMKWIGLK
ncbi:MAG: hypothetical protein PVG20_05200 [Thioalkalispiraceae bacterium]